MVAIALSQDRHQAEPELRVEQMKPWPWSWLPIKILKLRVKVEIGDSDDEICGNRRRSGRIDKTRDRYKQKATHS